MAEAPFKWTPMRMIGAVLGCGCLIFVVGFMGMVGIGAFALNNEGEMGGNTDSGTTATTACGTSIATLVPGFDMLKSQTGKLGHEEHLLDTEPTHYCGSDSGNCNAANHTGFVKPHTTDQERWYFNASWGGWLDNGRAFDTTEGADEARKLIKHAKLIITSKETGKSMVVSAEEFGPNTSVTDRDGIWYGAPPEVYNYLGTSNPYTKNPTDGKGEITAGFAEDQSDNTKLGPCL